MALQWTECQKQGCQECLFVNLVSVMVELCNGRRGCVRVYMCVCTQQEITLEKLTTSKEYLIREPQDTVDTACGFHDERCRTFEKVQNFYFEKQTVFSDVKIPFTELDDFL